MNILEYHEKYGGRCIFPRQDQELFSLWVRNLQIDIVDDTKIDFANFKTFDQSDVQTNRRQKDKNQKESLKL